MNNSLKIEQLAVEKLIPYVNNSRTHSEQQVTQIAASIKEFGFTNPVLIDENNGVIAGHGRIDAANKLGINDVPCVRLSHLSEAQRKAYIIADNQLALNGEWDWDKLKIEIQGLDELDFDLDLLGFDNDELGLIFKEFNDIKIISDIKNESLIDCYIYIDCEYRDVIDISNELEVILKKYPSAKIIFNNEQVQRCKDR